MDPKPTEPDTLAKVRAWRAEAFREIMSLPAEERRRVEKEAMDRLGLKAAALPASPVEPRAKRAG